MTPVLTEYQRFFLHNTKASGAPNKHHSCIWIKGLKLFPCQLCCRSSSNWLFSFSFLVLGFRWWALEYIQSPCRKDEKHKYHDC